MTIIKTRSEGFPLKPRLLGIALAVLLLMPAGRVLAQKAAILSSDRLNMGDLQAREEPRIVSLGIEVTAISQTDLSAALDPDHPANSWAKNFTDLPVHQLTVSGRNPVLYKGISQPATDDPVEIVFIAEDAKDLEACRQMATSLLTRTPGSPFVGQQKPLLFHVATDKAYVTHIWNPWKAMRVTVPIKSKSPEASPAFWSCTLWTRDIWGIP
jgi:hypothetical protein